MDGAAEATSGAWATNLLLPPRSGPIHPHPLLVLLQPPGWSPEGRDVAAPCGYDQGCPTMFVDDPGVFPEPLRPVRGYRAKNKDF